VEGEQRQFLLTAVWLFMRHGQSSRARKVCAALLEDDPRDGVAAVAMADLMLADGDAADAVKVLREADIPPSLEYAEAVLETRALNRCGRAAEGSARWRRYLESRKGASRQWIA